MKVRTLERSFSAGEVTPEFFGRVDLPKRQEALALCSNFITLAHGPAVNRPGFTMVNPVKNSALQTRVIPFSYNNAQTFAVEVGFGYFRFHTQGAYLSYATPAAWSNTTAYSVGSQVSYGGINYYCILGNTGQAPHNATYWYAQPTSPNIYEIPNPYTQTVSGAAINLLDIHYVQSADVMTLVHPAFPVQELRRYGAANWQLTAPQFVPPTCGVATLSAAATVTNTMVSPTTYTYTVTGVLSSGLQESLAFPTPASCTNDMTVTPNHNTLTWTDPGSGYVRYQVYRLSNGLYGFIGTTSANPTTGGTVTFVDQDIAPDVSITPPISDADAGGTSLFASANNYPSAVTYYQQRRILGGTYNLPQNIWATVSGTESNMTYHIPVLDSDRIAVRVAARDASAIAHIVPAAQLLLLTATCEFAVGTGVLTPTSIAIQPDSYIGANNVQPAVVNNIVLYAAARGGHVRELAYMWQSQSYQSQDICLLAPHLFDYNTIVDMAYARGPVPALWCVSSSGTLLGMTYVPEQQVAAWHQHHTANGTFESVCVITEQNEDFLYAVVNRTLNGVQTRFIERMHTRYYTGQSDPYYVDCGVTQTFGSPATTISGLDWLDGCTVNILADGAVQPQQVVTGGTITLQVAASTVTVGLPIVAQLQTLPAAVQIDPAYGLGTRKNVNKIFLQVYRSSGIYAGPSFTQLIPYKQRTTEPYGSPPNQISDEIEIVLTPSWGASAQVCVQQTDPLPLNIVSMTLELETGG